MKAVRVKVKGSGNWEQGIWGFGNKASEVTGLWNKHISWMSPEKEINNETVYSADM